MKAPFRGSRGETLLTMTAMLTLAGKFWAGWQVHGQGFSSRGGHGCSPGEIQVPKGGQAVNTRGRWMQTPT